MSEVTESNHPTCHLGLVHCHRAETAEAEVERLTAALAERDQRIAAALDLMDDRANSSPGYPLLERVLRGESDE